MEIIDRGGELPKPGDTTYGKFKRAFKQWYNEYCDPKGVNNDHVRARNKYYYDVGKEHLERFGVILTEIKKTGSVQINTPKPFGHSDDNDTERVFSYAIS